MKRKVLLTSLMIATFVFMFAISAFAATNIDGIYYSFSGTSATVTTDNKTNCELETVIIPKTVTYENTVYTVTTIASKAFGSQNANGGSAKIKNITIPATVTSIGSYAFANCPEITTVNCKATNIGERAFFDCNKLTTLTLENTVIIGSYAFTRIGITSLTLPATVTNSGTSSFKGCTGLTKLVVLGSILTDATFDGCTNLTELVLTENIEPFKNPFPSASSSIKFVTFYTGSNYEDVKNICSSSRFTNAGNCDYKDYVPGTYSGNMIVYNCNLCDVAYDGNHTEPQDDGDCTTAVICSMCGEYTYKEKREHVSGERLTYASFTEKGDYYVGCTNDGCTNGETTKKNALFTFLGYSLSEEGDGITTVYSINSSAIEFYELHTETTLSYGMYVALYDVLSGTDILNEEAAPSSGVLKIDLSNAEYSKATVKIAGIKTEEQKSAKLLVGAYVVAKKGDAKEISYLEEGIKDEGDKYCYITYNYVSSFLVVE